MGKPSGIRRSNAGSLTAIALTLRADQLAAKGARALAESSIPHLLMRGPVIARWLYEHPGRRSYLDADILVPPDRRDEAKAALAGIGMREVLSGAAPSEQAPHAVTFAAESAGGTIDLHWTVRGAEAEPSTVWSSLSRGAALLQVAGTAIPVPAEPARALLVALHAAQHGPLGPVQLNDIELAVENAAPDVWRRAVVLAEETGSLPAFASGLGMASRGDDLLGRLGVAVRPNAALAVRAQGEVPLALGLAELADAPGMRARLRLLARELWPTASFMRRWSPLARRGAPGLLLARVYRPFWLAVHLPAALRALRRAMKVGRAE